MTFMKIKSAGLLALFLLVAVTLRASTPATFVNFNAANATISGGDYKTLPITSSSTTMGIWNFDPTFTTPLVPATTTTAEIFGGLNVTASGTGTMGSTPYARLHNNNPPGWPNAPKVFLVSDAGSSGTNINNINMLYLWKRSDFTGNQPSYSDVFDSSSTLSVHITDANSVTGGDAIETRFIVLNGSTYYVSEAKATTTGTFTLTNFNNNSATGFRWAPITAPTSTSFDIPQSGLVYTAQTFGDVQAVGWIGRGSRNFSSLYGFDTFSATGLYSTPMMKMSMNLGGISYYTTSHPFLDVFKYTSGWITSNADNISSTWNTNLTGTYGLALDSNGWPTKLPFMQTLIPGPYSGDIADPRTTGNSGYNLSSLQFVHTLVLVYETGRYRLRFRGTGSLSIQAANGNGTNAFAATYFGPTVAGSNNPAGTALSSLPVDSDGCYYWDTPTITTTPGSLSSYIYLSIYGSDPNSTGDYIRNIEILSPSTFTAGVAGETIDRIAAPFNPDFYATLHNLATFRMMDWESTNNNPAVNWTDRTLPTSYTQCHPTGIALEYQIALCNTMGANMWVNVPLMATQDYVEKLALLLHNGSKADGTPYIPGTDAPSTLVWPGLNSGLKVYIEYSNETWNAGAFPAQYTWCQNHGQALGFPAGEYGDFYVAYQSANIWQWFYNKWGTDAPKRLVRVLGSQFTTSNAKTRLSGFTAGILDPAAQTQYPDALAVAPYFGTAVANSLVPTYVSVDGSINTATTPQIINASKADVEGNILTTITALKSLTNTYGVNLNCYEGGQSLVATGTNTNITNLTNDLIAANHDSTMGTLYTEYLGELQGAGVAEFCNFSHMGPWSKYGSWSVFEYLNQSTAATYKYNALVGYETSYPNANSNIPPLLDLTSTLSGTAVTVPAAVVDTTGAGSVVVPLSTANSVDYDGTVVSTQWIINGVVQSSTANTISPALPVGNDTITVVVTDNSGASTSDTIQIMVRPQGSDTVIAQSNFTGAGNSTTSPWTSTNVLTSGLGYTGWSFTPNSSGVSARVANTTYPNVLRVLLNNPYPGSGSPNNTVPELLTDALTQKQYLTVTVTPPAGHSLDLRGAAIQWTLNTLNNNQSARQTGLFVGVGGLAAVPAASAETYDSSVQYPNGMTSPDTFNYYFPVTSTYSNITQPVEIRIYFYGNVYNSKEVQLSNFQITGIYH